MAQRQRDKIVARINADLAKIDAMLDYISGANATSTGDLIDKLKSEGKRFEEMRAYVLAEGETATAAEKPKRTRKKKGATDGV